MPENNSPLKFIRYGINVWLVEESFETKLVGITKIENMTLEDNDFNKFIEEKLEIAKKIIDEI